MGKIINKSYRPFLILTSILLSGLTMSFAQDRVTKLDEIEITASSIKKFGVGATVSQLDSSIIQNYTQSSLATLLSIQSSAFIKQYGAGMLSTVSFRGTGASHTVVRWNGMQVGYPFLGQTDLSLIPLDFISEINLVHGSSSARFGTGAIGGIIDLQSHKPQSGLSVLANQSVGSFGSANSSLQVTTSGAKGYIKVGGLFKQSENNFPYKSSSDTNLGNQENANFSIQGLQFESAYTINAKNVLTFNLQNVKADRSLQPSIGSNAINNQKDANFWSSIIYSSSLKEGLVTTQYGFLYDKINYNGSVTDSKQHKTELIIEYDFGRSLSAEIGINSTWVEVLTPFYENNSGSENRSNLYASILWRLTNKLDASFNLRQAFVTGYEIPFTPSIGMDYNFINSIFWRFNVKTQLSKGYRVPTLNDRYWVPGGNLALEPEESLNAEIELDLKNNGNIPFWLTATTYKLWVDNWILWLPNGAIWSPENKRKVEGFGVEMEAGLEKEIGQANLKGWLNYAYTKSTNKEALHEYDRSAGKQLPYVPFHNGNITGQLIFNHWDFQLNGVVTGKRFITSDNETEVPGYMLLNARFGYKIHVGYSKIRIYLEANNITNTNYQSIINRAMPGVNFLAGAKLNFNK